MNINDYTGKIYNFRTYNCWNHVRAVRAAVGIDTPLFDVVRPCDANATFESGQKTDSKGLVHVDVPQNFDAVLMGCRHGGRIIWHSGVYYMGYISHCERAAKMVKLEAINDIRKRYQEIQFWR